MLPSRRRNPQQRLVLLGVVLLFLLFFSRTICGFIIDYFWWREMGQVPTWVRMSLYRYGPGLAAWLAIFVVLLIAHARGMKYAGHRMRDYVWYPRIATLVLAFVSLIIMLSTVDGWTVARYIGGRGAAPGWLDPVFGRPLGFYFFELPFYNMLIEWVAVVALGGALVYYLTARGWQLRHNLPGFSPGGQLDLGDFKALGRLESGLLKGLTALFLVALGVEFWLGRYDLLLSDHGNLMVGVDYVQQTVGLPMQTAKALASVLAAILVLAGRRKLAIACAVVLVIDIALPPLLSGLYVKPNELALEKPFLTRHIEATRVAYGIDHRAREEQLDAHKEGRIDFARNRPLLDNVGNSGR